MRQDDCWQISRLAARRERQIGANRELVAGVVGKSTNLAHGHVNQRRGGRGGPVKSA